jgi:DNA polymerase I-like protein with 3'-5' exonuclease and polymerase domains
MAKKTKTPRPATVDFETVAIDNRPFYPPPPTGVSIKYHGKPSRYYSWGHINGNNCSFEEASVALAEAYKCPDGVLFHHSKFDMEVASSHMGLPAPDLAWEKVHDTLYLIFLDDPHQKNMGLKPTSERLLGMSPEERDEVGHWLVENQPVPDVKISLAQKGKTYFMKYLAWAPGDLVGKYANGDVERTEKLFVHLYGKTVDRGMYDPYNRERQLLPVLREMENRGVRVDLPRLRADAAKYSKAFDEITAWILKKLKAPDLNLDSGAALVKALEAAGLVDVAELGVTAGGGPKTDKASLEAAVKDRQLCQALRYRSALKTCLGTFMKPWLATAEASGGLIFTSWNQIRSPDGGTRTGRMSSTPNFQNLPKEFSPLFIEWVSKNEVKKSKLPKMPIPLPELPLCRGYIIPMAEGEVLLGRDYSQQEPRILAHFEDGALKAEYLANPWIDYHDNAKTHLDKLMGRDLPRKTVKNINLGIIYGMGKGKMAEQTGTTVEEVGDIQNAIYNLYSGLRDMYKDMKFRAKSDLPIRTWGGREYFCEPPMEIRGRIMTFDYKLLNVLIQSSAADCTKTAMIRFFAKKKPSWKLLLQVHDELVISAPKNEAEEAMAVLRSCMESVEFDVPMLSEGSWSANNWSVMEDTDKKGKIVGSIQ